MDWVLVLLASAVPIVLAGGLATRIFSTKKTSQGDMTHGKGIGWQFIRFTVLGTGVPIIGLLALKGTIGGDVASALIAAAMGYAFGKAGKDE